MEYADKRCDFGCYSFECTSSRPPLSLFLHRSDRCVVLLTDYLLCVFEQDVEVPVQAPSNPNWPLSRYHFVTTPQAYSNPARPEESYQSGSSEETRSRSISVDMSMVISRPSVTLTITPTPVAERILSIAYPPSPSPSR